MSSIRLYSTGHTVRAQRLSMKAQIPSFPDNQPSPLCGPVIPMGLSSSHSGSSQPASIWFATPSLENLLPGRIKRPCRMGQGLCPGSWKQELVHETQGAGGILNKVAPWAPRDVQLEGNLETPRSWRQRGQGQAQATSDQSLWRKNG